MKIALKHTEGAYSRTLEADIIDATPCDACLAVGPMLCTDGSDGEYEPVSLCLSCINKAFAAWASHANAD